MPEIAPQSNTPQQNTPQSNTPQAVTKKAGFNWKSVLIAVLIGAMVIIAATTGLRYYLDQSQSHLETGSVTIKSATPAAQKDKTAGWKTYVHKELFKETTDKFSFKYPSDWALDASGVGGGFPVLNGGTDTQVVIGVYDGSTGGAAGGIAAAAERSIKYGGMEKIEDLTIDGKNAIRLKSKTVAEEHVLIDHGNNYVSLIFRKTENENKTVRNGQLTIEEKALFNKILSTFKFL